MELLERVPDRGVLVRRVLEFQHCQRQAVEEEHYVGSTGVPVLDHSELVDREPIVVVWRIEVDRARLRSTDLAFGRAVLDRHAVDQQAMHRTVALDQVRALGTREFAEGVFDCVGWQGRIQPDECVSQATGEQHVAVVAPFCGRRAGTDLRTMRDVPADGLQPVDSCVFDDGFRKAGHSKRLKTSYVRARSARQWLSVIKPTSP